MTYALVSTKTGGLDNQRNALLEIDVVLAANLHSGEDSLFFNIDAPLGELESGKLSIVDSFHSFVKPFRGSVIDSEAEKINNIRQEDLDNAPDEVEVLTNLNSFLTGYGKPSLTGYNSLFDIGFLKSAAFRNKVYLASDGIIIDLNLAARDVLNSYKYSLKSVCDELDIPFKYGSLRDKNLAAMRLTECIFYYDQLVGSTNRK